MQNDDGMDDADDDAAAISGSIANIIIEKDNYAYGIISVYL
jgi:hypothetical protein